MAAGTRRVPGGGPGTGGEAVGSGLGRLTAGSPVPGDSDHQTLAPRLDLSASHRPPTHPYAASFGPHPPSEMCDLSAWPARTRGGIQ